MKKTLLLLFVSLLMISGYSQVANTPSPYLICDDNTPDGMTQFDLTIKDVEVLGTQSPNDFDVTYHLTQVDADTGANVLPIPYTNVTNPQTIFVRIDELGTGNYDVTTLDLEVDPLPVVNTPSPLLYCDDDNDGFGYFTLTDSELEITGGATGILVTYHETISDAVANVNPLIDPYGNVVAHNQLVYVRVEDISNGIGCVNMTELELIVNPSPQAYASDTIVCDETGTGFATFDLGLYDNDFTNGNPNYTVTYHEVLLDAEMGVNSLASPYTNTVPYSQALYVSVVDNTSGCRTSGSDSILYLNIDGVSSTAPTPLVVIDTDNDGFADFNLTDKDAEITGGNTSLTVSYHETLTDAENNMNALNSPYVNIVANTQTIYARVGNQFQDCHSIEELVLQTEYASFVVNEAILELCHEGTEGVATFDLTYSEPTILDGLNASDYEVVYFSSPSNVILDPTVYVNTSNPQEIIVEVTETATNDFVATTLTLIVNERPYASFDQELTICNGETLELNPNGNPNYDYIWNTNETTPTIFIATEGFYSVTITNPVTGCESSQFVTIEAGDAPMIETPQDLVSCNANGLFNLETVTPEMLNGLDPSTVTISFYETLADAEAGMNPIANPDNYTAYASPQTIYVKVYSTSSYCYSLVDFSLISENCPTTITCGTTQNTTFCYGNNETQQYVFTSSDGSPLLVVFNSGMVEDNWDELIVLDSDGVTNLNAATPYGNDGDVSNMTFQSTGGSITIFVQSDFSIIGCEENPIDFDVFCLDDVVGVIEVNAFLDENGDGVFNGNDTPFTNGFFTYEVNDDGNVVTVSSTTGSFNIYNQDEANSYDVTFSANAGYENCYAIPTSLFEDVMVTGGNTVTLDFPITEQMQCEDLAVYLIPSIPPRPGFDYYNYLIIENKGYSTINSGSVAFINDPLVTYLGVGNVPSGCTVTPNATGFSLDFTNLLPGEIKGLWIEMNVPTSVNLGEFVTNTAAYTTAANDIVLDNNTSVLSEEVVGSYDPNDITESHGPEIVYEDFITTNEYLYYTVRFQNVGTAEAINVRIENTLNSLLDAGTFQLLNFSHDVVMKREGSQLTWFFNDIDLPAESQDAEGSNGYVYYRIKPNAGYDIGTTIPNTAEIYFDFNAPVVTNTFNTEFVEPNLSVDEFETMVFTLYPNPTSDLVNIEISPISDEGTSVSVYDLQGKLIMTEMIEPSEMDLQINVRHLQSGMYFVKLKNNTKETIKRLVVK